MSSSGWIVTQHAMKRCAEMNVSPAVVLAVIEQAEVSWPSFDRRVAVLGDLAVVFDPRTSAVITLLWHTQELYRRPEAAGERANRPF